MLGIEGYGSDSDNETTAQVAPKSRPSAIKPKPKKIAIALPSLPKSTEEAEDEYDGGHEERPAKRMKTTSSLLSMLPKPKQSGSFALPPPKSQSKPQPRLLGGGVHREYASAVATTEMEESSFLTQDDEEISRPSSAATAQMMFMPASLGKGKKNISLEEGPSQVAPKPVRPETRPAAPAIDFFSLDSAPSSKASSSTASSSKPALSTSISVPSAAPELPKFEPPEPTQTDPYPGYYQLPSGQWAAHDVEYYSKYLEKWRKEYDAYVRSLEKGTIKGFEGLQDSSVEEVNALKEMEKARKEIQEREEKKAITTEKGEPAKPRMNISASKMSGVARSRHQLSTLLKEAYENREALEERIAQGKRNRKEAGNKYGF